MAEASHSTPRPRGLLTATYRLQLSGTFTFADAAEIAPYLSQLGVSHLYLSPILQATPGSTHGYDVLDHTAISADLGGAEEFRRLSRTCRALGLGIIVDVVPNHMTVPDQLQLNRPLWSVLAEGPDSRDAEWFDIDWASQDGRIVMPMLACSADEALATGSLRLARDGGPNGGAWVLRSGGLQFPVRAGTEQLPLPHLLRSQHYRLVGPDEALTEVNYRRFFDISSLIGVRVEVPRVFHQTHDLLMSLARTGDVDGFRIDHPDGLADPADYLERLAAGTDDAWVLVEKILAPGESLPADWRTAGTTGYDALLRLNQVLTSPDQLGVLATLWAERAPDRLSLEQVEQECKRLVVGEVLVAERDRLNRLAGRLLPDLEPAVLHRALEALLIGLSRYRAYVRPGRPADADQEAVINAAERRAAESFDADDRAVLRVLAQLACGHPAPQAAGASDDLTREFVIRFQQTCVSVLAKAVEDTAFYRWLPLAGANEVGGDPDHLTLPSADFHAWCTERLTAGPLAMTASTTHDTKRSEDVRARSLVIAEDAEGWARWVTEAERLATPHRPAILDRATEYLLWQTLATAWPLTTDRLQGYLRKAIKEAKLHTTWHQPNHGYERAVADAAAAVVEDPAIAAHVQGWLDQHEVELRAAVLGLKLLALTIPGVPDLYQGSELPLFTLVDPDNRGQVDWPDRRERLSRLVSGGAATGLEDEKFRLCLAALQLRRTHPEWFVGDRASYVPVESQTPHVLAFGRGETTSIEAVTLVTRGAGRLRATGGWAGARVALPSGRWRDLLSGDLIEVTEEGAPLSTVLGGSPAALLVREG